MATPDQYEKHTRIWSGGFFPSDGGTMGDKKGPSHRTILRNRIQQQHLWPDCWWQCGPFSRLEVPWAVWLRMFNRIHTMSPREYVSALKESESLEPGNVLAAFMWDLVPKMWWQCAEMQNMVNFPSDVLWAGCQNVPPFKPGSGGLSGALSFLGLLLYFLLDIGKVDHGGSEGFGGTIWMFHPFSSHVHGPRDLQWTPNGVDRSGCIWLQASRKVGIPFAFAIFLCLLALSILAKSLFAKQHVLSL